MKQIEQWVNYNRLNGLRKDTLDLHSRVMRRLDRETNIYDPDTVTDYILRLPISDISKERYFECFAGWCLWNKIPYQIPKRHGRNPLPRAPMESDIDQLIANAPKKYVIIMTLLKETGMRLGEVCRLTKDNFDFDRKCVYIQSLKQGNPRVLPLSDNLCRMLMQYFSRKGSFGNPKNIRWGFGKIKKHTATKIDKPEIIRIHLHDFRHYYATRLYQRTKDILLVKKRLGHKQIGSTLVYAEICDEITPNNYHVAHASNLTEASKLIADGYEYVTEVDGVKIFRRLY